MNSVIGYSAQVKKEYSSGKQIEVPIKIIYEGKGQPEAHSRVKADRLLFSFGQVQQIIKRVLDSWIKNYDVAEPAFSLYFASKAGQHGYAESRFLALAQAIETLHRRTCPSELFPANEYEVLCQTVLECCPLDRRDWLEAKLRYGNELPLRARIKELVAPFARYFDAPGLRKRLVGQIVDTRNYLTHYDPALESRAMRGKDLWALCMRMEGLFELHLLEGLGLSHDEIHKIVMANEQLKLRLSGAWE